MNALLAIGYIYLIIDHYNNKVYVGQRQGLPENSTNYYGSGIRIRQIKKEKGLIHLEKRILGMCLSEKELDEAETECIFFYRAYGSDGKNKDEIYGYNLKPKAKGGNSRKKRSIETRKRISASLIGNQHHKGKKNTEESIMKMRIAHSNISDETRMKQRNAKLGKPLAENIKQKLSKKNSGKGNPMSGKSVHDIWIQKYGIDDANRLQKTRNQKHKITCALRKQKKSLSKYLDSLMMF